MECPFTFNFFRWDSEENSDLLRGDGSSLDNSLCPYCISSDFCLKGIHMFWTEFQRSRAAATFKRGLSDYNSFKGSNCLLTVWAVYNFYTGHKNFKRCLHAGNRAIRLFEYSASRADFVFLCFQKTEICSCCIVSEFEIYSLTVWQGSFCRDAQLLSTVTAFSKAKKAEFLLVSPW